MHYWASRGCDVHLVTHPESVAEVRGIIGARASGATACTDSRRRSSSTRASRRPHAAKSACPTTARSSSSRAAAGASGTSSARSRRRLTIPEVTKVVCLCGRNEALRSQLAGSFLGRDAGARRGLHGTDERMAGGRRRARALDRGPDRSRSADAWVSGHLLRLGSRSPASEQPGVSPLRARAGRGHACRASCCASPRARAGPNGDHVVQRPAIRRILRSGSGKCGADLLARAGWFVRRPHRSRPRSPACAGSRSASIPHTASRSRSTTALTPKGRRQCSRCLHAQALGRRSSSSASRWRATPRWPRRSRPPATRSRSTAIGTSSCCGGRQRRCARTSCGRTM